MEIHKNLAFLAKLPRKFDIKLAVQRKTVKTAWHFQLKFSAPTCLVSNVVYKLICLQGIDVPYIDMTPCHLATRIGFKNLLTTAVRTICTT